MIKISPSLLAADMGDLRQQLAIVEQAGVPYIHMDIMDGCFVPNISYGAAIVKSLRASSKLFFDVHMMVQDPDRYVEQFVKAGADLICIHAEATTHLHRSLQLIRSYGVQVGVALNPATPLFSIEDVLSDVDLVLLMSVNPGFGGQSFIPSTFNKISRLRKMREDLGLKFDIEVDGGIYLANVAEVVASGADVIVSGTGIFGADNVKHAAKEMIKIADAAEQNLR